MTSSFTPKAITTRFILVQNDFISFPLAVSLSFFILIPCGQSTRCFQLYVEDSAGSHKAPVWLGTVVQLAEDFSVEVLYE